MAHALRSAALLIPSMLVVAVFAAWPASAQSVESQVRAYSEDDHDAIYNEQCDPSPSTDPEADCGCDPFAPGGGGDEPDEKCSIDGDLFRFTTAPGVRVAAGSFACDVASCVFNGDPPDHGLGIAESDYGYNFVDVYSNTKTIEPWIHDEGSAVSRWGDILTLTTDVPDLAGATLRANLRVRGSWQNAPCLIIRTELRQQSLEPPFIADSYVTRNQSLYFDPICNLSFGDVLPGNNEEDFTLDHPIQLEIPLTFPATVSLFAELRAHAEGTDALFDGPAGGFEMLVESLEVPLGVEIASAAGALDAYNVVPEPHALAGAVAALAALLALRRR
jgi:hypothetical protein